MSYTKPVTATINLVEGEGINIDNTNPAAPVISINELELPPAGVQAIVSGSNISVDNTDPFNPVISSVGGSGSAVVLDTIASLEGYVGAEDVTFLKDEFSGGTFRKSNEALTADGGVTIAASGGGFWVRDFDRHAGISVKWFGAVGDGIADDLPAIMAAIAYVTHNTTYYGITNIDRPKLIFPDGLYRITDSIIIGGQPVSNADALTYQGYDPEAPSYNLTQLGIANATLPISLIFGQRAYILADFSPLEPTAAISYGCSGNAYGAQAIQSAIIDGLKVVVDPDFATTNYEPTYFGTKAPNIIGIVVYSTTNGITIQNCSFLELGYGMVANMVYFTNYNQMAFKSCGVGYTGLGGHASTGTMFQADHCNLGFDMKQGACCWNMLSAEQCKRALNIQGTNSTFNGIYFEQLDGTSEVGDYQITVGGDGALSPSNSSGLHFNTGVVTCFSGQDLLIKNDVYTIDFTGILSFATRYVTNPLTNVKCDWDPIGNPMLGNTDNVTYFNNNGIKTSQVTTTGNTTVGGNATVDGNITVDGYVVDNLVVAGASGGVVGPVGDPSYALSLQNNTSSVWLEFLNSGGNGKGGFFGLTGNNFQFWNYQAGELHFYTGTTASTGTKRMTITNTGKVIFHNTPIYANDAAAAGELAGTVYTTATGELRLKL